MPTLRLYVENAVESCTKLPRQEYKCFLLPRGPKSLIPSLVHTALMHNTSRYYSKINQSQMLIWFPTLILPKPSHVVPFWVVYYTPLPKNHNKPKKELHRSPWVVIQAFTVLCRSVYGRHFLSLVSRNDYTGRRISKFLVITVCSLTPQNLNPPSLYRCVYYNAL